MENASLFSAAMVVVEVVVEVVVVVVEVVVLLLVLLLLTKKVVAETHSRVRSTQHEHRTPVHSTIFYFTLLVTFTGIHWALYCRIRCSRSC